MVRITKEELLEKLFHEDYEQLKGKKLRITRLRIPGKEVCLAHVISAPQPPVYQNLGLHIGVHEGEDHSGESIGLIRFTPGGGGSGGGCGNEERGCADRLHGPLLRFPDHHRRPVGSGDRSGRGGPVLPGDIALPHL